MRDVPQLQSQTPGWTSSPHLMFSPQLPATSSASLLNCLASLHKSSPSPTTCTGSSFASAACWSCLIRSVNIFISSDLPPQPAKSQLSPKVLSQLSPPSPKSFWSSHSICSAWNFGPENKIPRLSDIFYRDQDFWISILERKAALRYFFWQHLTDFSFQL